MDSILGSGIFKDCGTGSRCCSRSLVYDPRALPSGQRFDSRSLALRSQWSKSRSSLRVLPMDETRKTSDATLDGFVSLAHELADAAAKITLKYFRTRIEVIDKLDLSPVTIADQAAEEAMRALILQRFPSHAVFGEEGGLTMPDSIAEYAWVLDPIDGTKSFITGKPVFGTLISLLHNGVPILGIIDQPVLKERWLGVAGQATVLNNREISTRSCHSLSSAYLYTTSPHLFDKLSEQAFARVREEVKVPLYGCDCYAYGLLAAGHVDLVVESGLKPYDYLALVPVVEGAGGVITDWQGNKLTWKPDFDEELIKTNVIAAGDSRVHRAALGRLDCQAS
ncbi:bifunctional phosphatase IMPL2, chloroplastic isoform X2 [Selaginella moellendorffii]|uniref:bifunctional phosphatase IMPL2, chloroplastic isoform X2 n=1 Tax=Selaginella moellendorffii TaxID=88036 RepID=UPI000D1CACB1|nr:bifunctional phosphatase IMPL2, chloroplastic isoform X2 [Selaginella moellendorffii]|eukprot:XP_024522591.1 bifunctional phosphatase IMPL2, chloroplastic isoform X2 [Selaginella moellendorffii]